MRSTVHHTPPTPEVRRQAQARVLRVLTGGQVVGSAALGSAVTVGAFVVQDILGDDTAWGGLAAATVTLGTALASALLAALMRRHGRRPGLAAGYGAATAGGLVAALGAETRSLPVFVAGLLVYGGGQAANLLARYAATDLALPADRARAMGRVVFASTFGAVFGPLMVGPAQYAGQQAGLGRYTGPWLFGALVFACAAANVAARLRPDPLLLAGLPAGTGTGATAPAGRGAAWRALLSTPASRTAVFALAASQATMAGVMAMTPVHMKLHGHEEIGQYVVSLHIAGMFAFAPLVGRFAARRGSSAAVVTGGVLLAAATVVTAVSGEGPLLLFPGLWLLGVGWSFGLIGASTLLGESLAGGSRVAAQGLADLLMSVAGGVAAVGGGFVRQAIGYHLLSTMGTVLAGVMVLAALGQAAAAPARPALTGAAE